MEYLQLTISVWPKEPFTGILIAELAELPFDSFTETEDGLEAYAPAGSVNREEIDEVLRPFQSQARLRISISTIPATNWNEVWERNFTPVNVEDKVLVRADFHPVQPGITYDIRINPKMSFGTGHHHTTWLMLKWLLKTEVKGAKVLDMGCGTGILAILAGMRGASSITAVDIDEWSVENTRENIKENIPGVPSTIIRGDVDSLQARDFSVILANINRNVLLQHLPYYEHMLKKGGTLLLSGFYTRDIAVIRAKAEACNFSLTGVDSREDWAILTFTKI